MDTFETGASGVDVLPIRDAARVLKCNPTRLYNAVYRGALARVAIAETRGAYISTAHARAYIARTSAARRARYRGDDTGCPGLLP